MKKLTSSQINAALKKIYEEKGITTCEIRFSGCTGSYALSFAHRHKRRWYYGQQEKLKEFKQTLLSCINCHIRLETDKKLTQEYFKKLRGEEH